MKIGELAKRADCPVETVRYYEKKGLLIQPQRDPENNYRRYETTHLEKLLFIRRCRALDMAHEEIRALLEAMNNDRVLCTPIDEVVSNHLEHVQHRIRELQLLETELKQLKGVCNSKRTVSECGILEKLCSSEEPNLTPSLNKKRHLSGVH